MTGDRTIAQVPSAFELNEPNLVAFADYVDRLMPGHRLPLDTVAAAAGMALLVFHGWLEHGLATFAELTSLEPGTRAYYRAEFRNVIFACGQGARVFNRGRKAPAFIALYEAFSAGGCGPHPDLDLARKHREGLSEAEREERARGYRTWSSHLRNRVALVRRALDPRSALSGRRRKSILGADPLIAMELRHARARPTRVAGNKVRT